MTDHTLTRRDALAALAAAGIGGAVAAAAVEDWDGPGGNESPLSDDERATLVALAGTLYPSAVEGIPEFVETYLAGRGADRPERVAAIADAAATLDGYAREYDGARYVDLSGTRRHDLLEDIGVDVVDPDPSGTEPARLRYYLVNELLFALYTSPTGGRLLGVENPQGYPGGTDSYRRGPD
jgi:hypothetical protein